MAMTLTVASTEFQTRAGLYMDRAAKAPVFITKHRRPVRVLIDIDEYERLKSRDSREAFSTDALPPDILAALASADYGETEAEVEAALRGTA
jgi:prevent-host-death family protein